MAIYNYICVTSTSFTIHLDKTHWLHIDTKLYKTWYANMTGLIYGQTSSSSSHHNVSLHYFKPVGWWLKGLKPVIRAVVCHLVYNPIICVVSTGLLVAFPTPPINPSETCQCRGEWQTEAAKDCAGKKEEEKKQGQFQIRIQMLFCGKELVWVPACWREWRRVWILKREGKEILYCQRLASRETNIKRKHVTVWWCTSWGGTVRLLRTESWII